MRRWLRFSTGPTFWIAAVQTAWTVTLVLWIVFFVDRRAREPHPGWGVLVTGIVGFVLMLVGVTVIVVHLGRQVAHNRAVKDFVSRVSHDLRSPLTTVKLHLQTIALRDLTAEQRRECLDTALVELARLENGIEDVLTASRLERQSLRIAAERVRARDFLDDYVAIKRKAVAAASGKLLWEREGTPDLEVLADPMLLRQILDNLVDNALAHCPPGVAIRVELGEQAGQAIFAVIDDGPGLERSEWRKVFRMFYRGDRSKSYTKGTGLGLFIVAGIAAAHGGKAWVDSPGPGKGCNFRVAIPKAPPEEGVTG
jgi:signal transduction histidine kinase